MSSPSEHSLSNEAAIVESYCSEGKLCVLRELLTMLNESFLQVFDYYFHNETTTPSLARFVKFNRSTVINSSPRTEIMAVWNERFLGDAKVLGIEIMKIHFFECMYFCSYIASATFLDLR